MKFLRYTSRLSFFHYFRFNIFVIILFFIVIDPLFSKDNSLSKGKKFFYARSYKKAEKALKNSIKNDSLNAEAYYFLGYTMSRILGKYHEEIPQTNWKDTETMSQYFEKVLMLQKDYQGEQYILSPQDKLMSEWSVLALRYLYEDNENMAQNALKEMKKRGGFNPALSEFMRNMLISCPLNAILITYGDMDTFHGMYLQVMEKFRTDVTIVNIHLLQDTWYIKYLEKAHSWQKNTLVFHLTLEDRKDKTKFQKKHQNTFTISIPAIGCHNEPKQLSVSITPIRDKNPDYVPPVNELVLLKLIEGNPEKPICFAMTVPAMNHGYHIEINGRRLDLDSVLELKGLVNQVTFCKKDSYEQARELKNLLLTQFHYTNIPNSPAINTMKMFHFYVASVTQIAQSLEKFDDTEKARELVTAFVKKVPGIQYLENKTMRNYLLGTVKKNNN